MGYYTKKQLEKIGFKSLGVDVKISDRASIYNANKIEIGDYSRIEDFCTLAYGVMVFTQSDDYSGATMTNSTIPKQYKTEVKQPVLIKRHSIIGAGSIIFPGVTLNEGTSVGAMSLIRKSTEEWSIYVGNPAVKIKNRKKIKN